MILFLKILFLLLLLSIIFPNPTQAKSLLIKSDGTVLFVESSGTTINALSEKGLLNYYSNVLGETSGVTVTVSVSPFLPTDTPTPSPTYTPTPTPTPTPTHTPTPTPTGTQSSTTPTPTYTPTPTHTPTPTLTPTPTPIPSGGLIATVTDSTSSNSEIVDEVVIEDSNGETFITIVYGTNDNNMIIKQGDAEVTTDLPLTFDPENKTINVATQEENKKIITPEEALQAIIDHGSFIIQSSMKTELIEINGVTTYVTEGKEKVLILGLFIIELPVRIEVNATTGEVIKVESSLRFKILEFLRIGKRVIK